MGAPNRTLTLKINSPAWREQLDREQERIGCLSRAECVENILGSYFGRKGEPEATMATGTTDNPPPPQQPASATPPAASSPSSDLTAMAREIGTLSARATGAEAEARRWEQEAKAAQGELDEWKSMGKHAPVPQILAHLGSCPNCKPEMDKFMEQQIAALPVERVKELARQHKFWPPPPIEFTTRKARA